MTEWDFVCGDGDGFGHGDRLTPGPSPSGERGGAFGEMSDIMGDSDERGNEATAGVRISGEFAVRGVNGRQRDNARVLRKYQTLQEELLWRELRGRKIEGLKFRRQVPVGRFIVDFMCFEAGLIVEIDGSQHADLHVREYDNVRTSYLNDQGFEVLRFTNMEIERQFPRVIEFIRTMARTRTTASLRAPLSPEGEGRRVWRDE